MQTVKGLIGEVLGLNALKECSLCGCSLHGDHGYVLTDGTVVCRRSDKCQMQQSRNKVEAAKKEGTWKPRWRTS